MSVRLSFNNNMFKIQTISDEILYIGFAVNNTNRKFLLCLITSSIYLIVSRDFISPSPVLILWTSSIISTLFENVDSIVSIIFKYLPRAS